MHGLTRTMARLVEAAGHRRLNADGRADILWRDSDGYMAIWFMADGRFLGDAYPRRVPSLWRIKGLLGDAR